MCTGKHLRHITAVGSAAIFNNPAVNLMQVPHWPPVPQALSALSVIYKFLQHLLVSVEQQVVGASLAAMLLLQDVSAGHCLTGSPQKWLR